MGGMLELGLGEQQCLREGYAMLAEHRKTLALPMLSESERHRKIAAIAYQLWLDRGFRGGSPAEDWLRAERKVLGKAGVAKIRRTPVGDFLVA